MRRSIIHAAVVSLVTLTIGACADTTPTGLTPSGHSNAATPPPGSGIPLPPVGRPGRIDPNDFVDIVAGENHTCARKYNNTVYCWGWTWHGQTGLFPTGTCAGVQCVDRPTILHVTTPQFTQGILTATQIDAGSNHTCIIDTLNDVYCWGEGDFYGQNGTPGNRFEPTKLATSLKFTLIGAGAESTCGATSGGVYCWGKLGRSKSIPTLGPSFTTFKALAIGNLHGCGIDGQGSEPGGSGIIYCWGDNQYGQLGADPALLPNTNNPFFTPTTSPRGLARGMLGVSIQSDFTCAQMPDGTDKCFGLGTNGQLGNGQSGPGASNWVAQVVGTANVSAGQLFHGISAGVQHACALDANNKAWCWGNGTRGQLGNGSSGGSLANPQAVATSVTFRAIAAGGSHTCGIGTDNHIYCWGDNTYQQLGAQLTVLQGGFFSTPQPALDPIP